MSYCSYYTVAKPLKLFLDRTAFTHCNTLIDFHGQNRVTTCHCIFSSCWILWLILPYVGCLCLMLALINLFRSLLPHFRCYCLFLAIILAPVPLFWRSFFTDPTSVWVKCPIWSGMGFYYPLECWNLVYLPAYFVQFGISQSFIFISLLLWHCSMSQAFQRRNWAFCC